ncbi:hypothetical protein SKAU_G00181210 [Synaphobranchus kaupii]|uniref:Uncharacterized protein n=1 Tax=Synaphobranchus kaupii TaxID=118154 RepID=A0A9Q1FMF7_SYNKA|nr:hypothetical protein SKAU_G00181210 [Synaphobranchus kaupii]
MAVIHTCANSLLGPRVTARASHGGIGALGRSSHEDSSDVQGYRSCQQLYGRARNQLWVTTIRLGCAVSSYELFRYPATTGTPRRPPATPVPGRNSCAAPTCQTHAENRWGVSRWARPAKLSNCISPPVW